VELKGRIASAEHLLLSLVVSLVRQQRVGVITLRTYLENLRWLAWRWSDRCALSFEEFVELLCLAFVPVSVEEASSGNAIDAFLEWDQRVTDQIHELLEAAGQEAPDPCDYLQSAVEGAFREWPESDAGAKLRRITWAEFADFLTVRSGPRQYLHASGVSMSSASRSS
jgi:hypothetical protein